MADYKKLILEELLNRYERSRHFREGVSGRRVLIHAQKDEPFLDLFENADRHLDFLRSLKELEMAGLIGFSWVRFEEGNLVDRIWLRTEPDHLAESYRAAGRIHKEQSLQALQKSIGETTGSMPAGDLRDFLDEELAMLTARRKVSRFFFEGDGSPAGEREAAEKNRRLFALVREVAVLSGNELERVLSTRLFGDSKQFERELKGKLLIILRELARRDGRSDLSDEELLTERGIFKWPEVLEFCGPVTVTLDDGRSISYEHEQYGAYINAETLRHAAEVSVGRVRRVISIENKANYTVFLQKERQEGDLIIYHGGCASPAKGRWFRMLAAALEGRGAVVLHWSDIDLGGFRIYRRFREEYFPEALPWRMDISTLKTYRPACIPLGSTHYRTALAQMAEDEACSCFAEVIRYMLAEDVRLEQEAEVE